MSFDVVKRIFFKDEVIKGYVHKFFKSLDNYRTSFFDFIFIDF